MSKLAPYRFDRPRCRRLALEPSFTWCEVHGADWPARYDVCSAVREALRHGQVIVRMRPRLWSPLFWILELRRWRRARG